MGFNWYTALFVLGKGKNMEFTESLKKNYQFRFVYNRGKSITVCQKVSFWQAMTLLLLPELLLKRLHTGK